MEIILRDIELWDLNDYLKLNHPDKEFHKFNWPYYKQNTLKDLENYVLEVKQKLENWEKEPILDKKMIIDKQNNKLIWAVNWYWKSQETNWIEIWVVIFNENYWGKWIWFQALKIWIQDIFLNFPNLVRIWLSTWSGNIRMMKLAEKLWLQKEACYKKARIVNGEYYDSLSYWILKEDWYKINN